MELDSVFVGRLLLAALLGAFVGGERDISGRPAGIRTNLIIAVSSCLFTILSGAAFDDNGAGYDASRIASQVVVGVGFLGAGALIHNRDSIVGLTTAADIWLVAAIGMAVGAGMYTLAAFTAIFAVTALIGLAPLSHRLSAYGRKSRGEKRGVRK